MKNLALIATAAIGLFAASSLHAQDSTTNTTTTRRTTRTTARTTTASVSARNNARLNARLRTTQRANVGPVTTVTTPRLDGGVVRAVRSDNPLQAINPFAPAEYGSGEQVTRHDPDDPFQRAQGLKLVTVEF